MLVEQIIYTPSERDPGQSNQGYRVIAKSSGITEDLLKFVDNYHYPIGINNLEVLRTQKFKSLLKFKKLLIYTVCIDASPGYDGRMGTLYTQHFVFKKEDFHLIDYDTKNLDPYFVKYPHTIRDVSYLHIPESKSKFLVPPIKHIDKVIAALVKQQKVALISKHVIDIQNLLGLLTDEERIIEFCNMMFEPNRQWNFRFFTMDWGIKYKLKGRWKIFDLD